MTRLPFDRSNPGMLACVSGAILRGRDLGEMPAPDAVAKAITALEESGPDSPPLDVEAFDDGSAAFRSALVEAFVRGNYWLACDVLPHLPTSPRVRGALVAAVETAPSRVLGTLLQAVVLGRVEDCVHAVRRRLSSTLSGCHDARELDRGSAKDALGCAWALVCLTGAADGRELLRVLRHHPDRIVRLDALQRLGMLARAGDEDSRQSLLDALRDGDGDVRDALGASMMIWMLSADERLKLVEDVLQQPSSREEFRFARETVACALNTDVSDEESLERLARSCLARAPNSLPQHAWGFFLARRGRTEEAKQVLSAALQAEFPFERWLTVERLIDLPGGLGQSLAKEALVGEPDPLLRRHLQRVAGAQVGA